MSLKRKHSVVDLTATSPQLPLPPPLPLPLPLTSRPLAPRADSPASSRSSRSSRGPKRPRRAPQVPDVDASEEDIKPVPGPSKAIDVDLDAQPWEDDNQDSDVPLALLKPHGGNAVAGPSKPSATRRPSPPPMCPPTPPPSNLLSTHTCPICFSSVTNACLTPCGHVLCGACLFASVKSGIQRSLASSIPIGGEGTSARCPVCRAVLKGWDGKGAGIIPLKIRTIVAL